MSALKSSLSGQAGFEVSPDSIGLLGAVIVDMQASFLPSERVEKGPFVAYERPRDVAYISNLAVVPRARRQGVGEQLLLAAEKVVCYTNVLSDMRSMVLSTPYWCLHASSKEGLRHPMDPAARSTNERHQTCVDSHA